MRLNKGCTERREDEEKMKSRLLIILTMLMVCGCKYVASTSNEESREKSSLELVLHALPTDIVRGREEVIDEGRCKAIIEVEVALPREDPYRKFVEQELARAYMIPSMHDKDVPPGIEGVVGYFRNKAIAEQGKYDADAWHWHLILKGGVTWFTKNYLSYRGDAYIYDGCMYPLEKFSNGTWSMRLGRKMTRADLLDTKDYAAIGELIAKSVLADWNSKENEIDNMVKFLNREYFYPAPEALVTDNFRLTSEGVIWTYNQGEYWSMADGMIEALVPYTVLKPYLRDPSLVGDDVFSPSAFLGDVQRVMDAHKPRSPEALDDPPRLSRKTPDPQLDNNTEIYITVDGDDLTDVCLKYGITSDKFRDLNDLWKEPSNLTFDPGTKLLVPKESAPSVGKARRR